MSHASTLVLGMFFSRDTVFEPAIKCDSHTAETYLNLEELGTVLQQLKNMESLPRKTTISHSNNYERCMVLH